MNMQFHGLMVGILPPATNSRLSSIVHDPSSYFKRAWIFSRRRGSSIGLVS
jgi:hypothetical protein